jgi:hypothetical protein
MKRIIKLTESDLARIVRRVIREEEGPKEDLAQCCKDAGITAPLSCTTGDVTKCMKDLGNIVISDPLGMGMKAVAALNCLKDKQNSPVQY